MTYVKTPLRKCHACHRQGVPLVGRIRLFEGALPEKGVDLCRPCLRRTELALSIEFANLAKEASE